jgi:hypothetical protein
MTIIAERASVITNETALRPLAPAAPPDQPTAEPRSRRAAAACAVFAVYADGVAVFSGPGHDRCWGIWASFGYAAAAAFAAAWPTRSGRLAGARCQPGRSAGRAGGLAGDPGAGHP